MNTPALLIAYASTSCRDQEPRCISNTSSGHAFPAAPFGLALSHFRSHTDRRFWDGEEEALDSKGHVWSRRIKLTTDNFGTLVEVAA